MSDPLFFDDDIAPTRGRFFPSNMSARDRYAANLYRGMSSGSARRSSEIEAREVNPIVSQLRAREELDRRRRMEDLAYERSRFELRQRKKDARLKRQSMQDNPTLTTELDEIVASAADDPMEAQKKVMSFVTRNGRNIQNDEALKAAVEVANSAIGLAQSKKSERDKNTAAMAQIKIAQGKYDEAANLATSLPSSLSAVIAASIETTKKSTAAAAESKAETERRRQEATLKDKQKATDSLAKQHLEVLAGDLENISSPMTIAEMGSDEAVEPEPIDYSKQLKNRSKAIIYKRASDLSKSSPSFARVYGSSKAELEKSLADPELGKFLVQEINNYLVNMRTGGSVQESGVDLSGFGD